MRKFAGYVGFVLDTEVKPGVFMPKAVEKFYKGEINNQYRRWDQQQEVSDQLTLSEEITIVTNSYLLENIGAIRYVVRHGTRWAVKSIGIKTPKIVLTLGGEYNGVAVEETNQTGGDSDGED